MTNPFPRIYLASRSPRRSELLQQIGVVFDPLLADTSAGVAKMVGIDETADPDETPHPGEDPKRYVIRLAREKAETGWRRLSRAGSRADPQQHRDLRPVLAADTTVILDGRIFGKPGDAAEAATMLRMLSGRTHRVLTAIAIVFQDRLEEALSESDVSFAELSDADIRQYIGSGEPFDKAGAYGIQGHAAAFVREIRGSYSGIVGLPLHETAQLLRRFM